MKKKIDKKSARLRKISGELRKWEVRSSYIEGQKQEAEAGSELKTR